MLKKSKSISAFAVVSALLLSISAPAIGAPPVKLSCALGGKCAVGDTGPGGGTVYYFNRKGFNCGLSYSSMGSPTGGLCHYLEVAPSTWSGVSDPTKAWAGLNYLTIDVPDITNESSPNNSSTGIGLGYKNSDLIVTQNVGYNSDDYAAGAARAYAPTVSGVTYSDWYLPTTAELNLLYQWKTMSKVPVVGFVNNYYRSSSEGSPDRSWNQNFSGGSQNSNLKNNSLYVRPVRAF